MAAISLTYTLTNGTTADASQVMQNFNDIVNGTSDGTKDFSINALTCAGTLTANGNVTLGNASADDLTVNASLASNLVPKTTNTYNIGSADIGLAGVYFGTADTDTARIVSAALSADRTYTLPDAGAAADFVMTAGAQTITGSKTFTGTTAIKGTATNDSAAAGDVGEYLEAKDNTGAVWAASSGANGNIGSISLTAGDWDVSFNVFVNDGSGVTSATVWLATASASTTGRELGSNTAQVPAVTANLAVADFRVSITSTTTYYLVGLISYASAPTVRYRVSARRAR